MYRFEDEELPPPELHQTITVDGTKHTITIHIVRLPFVFENDTEHIRRMLTASIQQIFQ